MTSLLSFTAVTSVAGEVNGVDMDQYLLNSCNAFKANKNNIKTLPCITYIKGFFNGVLDADKTDVLRAEGDNQDASTFVERAYATRVGKRSERKSLNYSCFTVEELKTRIFADLADDSLNPIRSVKELNTRLVNILRSACSTGSKSK